MLADHGAFNGVAAADQVPGRLLRMCSPAATTLEAAYCQVTAVYTNKAPGGVAYACSFRITEAVYLVERMVDCLAYELKMDPAELRLQNLLRARAVPVQDARPAGCTTPATTRATMRLAMDIAGYDELRARAGREARAR